MAEITDTGYKLKSQNEYFSDEVALYKAIDPDWDLDPSSPDGLKAAHDAEIFYALDEALQRAYNSKDPEKARGIELDQIAALAGLTRTPGTHSDVTIRFTGNPGAVVLAGTQAESIVTGMRWTIDQAYTILPSGYVDATATAADVGPTAADANTIRRLASVVSGVTGCNNPAAANLGLDPQSDASLRIQRRRQVGKPSNNQLDSMYAEIMQTPDVRRAAVYNNPTGVATVSDMNPYGLPAHSIAVIVDGGTNENVAMSMYLKLNPGTGMAQPGMPVSEPVESPIRPSNVQIIKFSRPIAKPITLVINVNGADLPEDVEDQIKTAVMDYAVGSLLDPSIGFRSTGFNIGDDVPYSSIFTPVNKIVGQYGESYVSSLTINGGTANIAVAYNELSQWSTSSITVNVTR